MYLEHHSKLLALSRYKMEIRVTLFYLFYIKRLYQISCARRVCLQSIIMSALKDFGIVAKSANVRKGINSL